MKYFTLTTLAAALAFATAPAFADQPTAGIPPANPNTGSQGSPVGQASSAYIHNGSVIGGNHGNAGAAYPLDQTTSPGSRPNGQYGPQTLLGHN